MGLVINQAQDGDAAGVQVQQRRHLLLVPEGQAAHPQLTGELLGLEGLVPRHDQQIKARLLPVAEKEILADMDPQDGVHLRADLHGGGGGFRVVRPVELHPQPVQEFIGLDLSGAAPTHIRRRTMQQFHLCLQKYFVGSFYHACGSLATRLVRIRKGKWAITCGRAEHRPHA